ncbi:MULTISPECIES: adenylate/guanylate cyclase domain-containing protein [Sphingomonas]|uniref:adenylate/guanylate cyclase domain-containing protein n=1 Tax=Sphingomonas TaxID=13687 RepID=UPI0009E8760F|nr:adenylate/guanylate cyclase domain-containing protein [Sphingomonas sp. CCH10-B3]
MAQEDAEYPEHVATRQARMHMRLDLVKTVQTVDEESRTVKFSLVPDPRRYDRVEMEGGTWYLDRYFQTLIRLEDFAGPKMNGLPVYRSDRTVDSALEYAGRRRDAIAVELQTGEHQPPKEAPRAHGTLTADDSEREMAFLSVDICGSTAYRRRDAKGFDQAYQILLQEFGTTVGQFQGKLLKATGDGFIAYVDGPGVNVLVDNSIDLGCSLIRILHDAINPAIEAHGLTPLAIRVGADFGPAVVREVKIATTGFASLDVMSDALNRAVKIEQSAEPNSFRVGFDLYRLAHVQWLERSHKVNFDGASVGISGYKVFEVQ